MLTLKEVSPTLPDAPYLCTSDKQHITFFTVPLFICVNFCMTVYLPVQYDDLKYKNSIIHLIMNFDFFFVSFLYTFFIFF